MRRFRALAVVTSITTLVLIVWGGIVRATGSGDGCPDWPTCFGRWVPRFEYHTLIEYVHRLLGVVGGVLAVGLALLALGALLRSRRGDDAGIPRAAIVGALTLPFLFGVQGALGGRVVNSALDPLEITFHFAMAMIVLGVLVATTAVVTFPRTDGRPRWTAYARLAATTAAATYALLLVGTYVRAEGAGLAFRDWPLMGGRLVPSFGPVGAVEMFAHRLLALLVTSLAIWAVVRARTMAPRSAALVRWSTIVGGLFAAQVVVGAFNVWTELSTIPRAAHVGLSALIWASTIVLVVVARRAPDAVEAEAGAATGVTEAGAPAGAHAAPLRDVVQAYVALTKPRIIVLLLITTVPAMVLAARSIPSHWLVAATLLGGALSAGSANAINMYLDRDIDEVMRRTRGRPLPAHAVTPDDALRFGFVLGAFSFVFLAMTVNVLAAVLSLAAIAFYVFVYTMWLKRATAQNIVIGGAAGAAPALVGWAAVTGSLALPAWILFAIVFVWTPPHFWALAMRFQGDYAAAGVPMLPVVRGETETRKQILLYSLALFGTTLVLVPVAPMGPVYTAAAVVLGGMFVYRALALWRAPSPARSWSVFRFSVLYLGALFGAVAADALV
ncbi:MAG TPA: heme o synthase [Actinomycetota bacterium]|nr:heme o synthase [Actinomycetota bacterium]